MGGPNAALTLKRVRLVFEALDPIVFPNGSASNILRGALGTLLSREASAAQFSAFFRPRAHEAGPSGLKDAPRPFAIRAAHLDGQSFDVGQSFHFYLHVFDWKQLSVDVLESSFARLAIDGLGVGRKRVALLRSDHCDVRLPLAGAGDTRRVTIHFLTPTELKTGSGLAAQPGFGVLMARVRDRISSLCELYGDGAPNLDFKALGERALLVQMTRCDIRPVQITRRSTHTGQVHSIGGFVGEADYEGALGEFIPWLKAAWWTGVGRQTAWGKGIIEVSGAQQT